MFLEKAYGCIWRGKPRGYITLRDLLFPLQILVIKGTVKGGQSLAEPFEKRIEAG